MLARSVVQIIENMGFVHEDENRWVADFLFDPTGNVLTIVAYQGENKEGIPMLLFDACSESGNVLSTSTLDQIMLEIERCNLVKVPEKSNKKYIVTMNATIKMPVDMDAIMPETYRMYIEDGCTEETEIVNSVAKYDVTEYCNGAPFSIYDIDFESIEEVTFEKIIK